jgi:hypothetical protein
MKTNQLMGPPMGLAWFTYSLGGALNISSSAEPSQGHCPTFCFTGGLGPGIPNFLMAVRFSGETKTPVYYRQHGSLSGMVIDPVFGKPHLRATCHNSLGDGFFSGCMILSFAFARESVPPSLSGTVSGLTNMGVVMGPMLLQPVVGLILDRHYRPDAGGLRVYSLEAYEIGFIPIMGWILLSVLLLLFTRETHCRQMV